MRVLFVRHPFERLASVYKERIATLAKDRIQAEPHYDTIRKMICRRYAWFDAIRPALPRGIHVKHLFLHSNILFDISS